MTVREQCLRTDERIAYALAGLYGDFGYRRFKMGKFEEYELYAQNKDFLVGDRMITFTGGDGRLMALKPDVTISIIKNTQEDDKALRKVYYHESVYRNGKGELSFREIMQTGLECIGDVDTYQMFEVIYLAARSLSVISPNYVLDISHMGLISGMMKKAGVEEKYYAKVLDCIREKNPTDLQKLSQSWNLSEESFAILRLLIDTYGDAKSVLQTLKPYATEESAVKAMTELSALCELLESRGMLDKIKLDFSVASDMGYYNGIVFKGFLKGVAESVLSGGRYDKLVEKMGKKSKAIGFAITLNLLERLESAGDYDVDLLYLYDEETKLQSLFKSVEEQVSMGKKVCVQKVSGEKLRYRELCDMRGGN